MVHCVLKINRNNSREKIYYIQLVNRFIMLIFGVIRWV